MADVLKIPQLNVQILTTPKPNVTIPKIAIQIVATYLAEESAEDASKMFLVM